MSENQIKLKCVPMQIDGRTAHKLVDIDSGKELSWVRSLSINETINEPVTAIVEVYLTGEQGEIYTHRDATTDA